MYFRESMTGKNEGLMREIESVSAQLAAAIEDVKVLC